MQDLHARPARGPHRSLPEQQLQWVGGEDVTSTAGGLQKEQAVTAEPKNKGPVPSFEELHTTTDS